MQFSSDDVVVFDLDDTLCKEIDFVRSGYKAIVRQCGLDDRVADEMLAAYHRGENALQYVIERYGLQTDIPALLKTYREHEPEIELTKGAARWLAELREKGVKVGIISDGRSLTQRNKIKALGLEWIEDVIISEEFGSEKPSLANYQWFERKYPSARFTYVGDNVRKDFVAPNKLGWHTICVLDDGRNIHRQDFDAVGKEYLAKDVLSLSEL